MKRLRPPPPEPHQPGRLLVEGVHCLYKPHDPMDIEFDILFIHGLQVTKTEGFWWRTWSVRSDNNTESAECWPEKWIGEEFPKARVLALEYNSCARGTEPLTLWNQAIAIVNDLGGRDVELGTRPYFLVGHSMGGLLAKEFLLRADTAAHRRKTKLLESCKGIVFYGVPHLGTDAANWARYVNNLFFGGPGANEFVTEELLLLGEKSIKRNRDFTGLVNARKFETFDFAEIKKTKIAPGIEIMVVSEVSTTTFADSAKMCMVDANHYDVCRPALKTDKNFRSFINFVKDELEKEGILHSGRQLNIQ